MLNKLTFVAAELQIQRSEDNVFGDLLKKNAQTYFTYSSPFLNSYLNFILNTIIKKT
ncbi:MAG: hypothetical protein ACI9N1_000175 [Flavobacteriales bacterium]|jgi:hypothetical protein